VGAPPGLLWTWYDDRFRVEAAIQIARSWTEFAANGVDPWASDRVVIDDTYREAVKVRKQLRDEKRHRMNLAQYHIISDSILEHVVKGWAPARGAEIFVEPAILRWRYKDALEGALDAHRRVDPHLNLDAIPRRVRQAFEAIILADEVATAYEYLGATPTWWAPERVTQP
jgi:hypothetical protein